ncbi:hypothetical protein SRHO_G00063900 [Serrasalmus rhombeus]
MGKNVSFTMNKDNPEAPFLAKLTVSTLLEKPLVANRDAPGKKKPRNVCRVPPENQPDVRGREAVAPVRVEELLGFQCRRRVGDQRKDTAQLPRANRPSSATRRPTRTERRTGLKGP